MLVLIDPKTNKAVCGTCGSLVFKGDEDAWGATERHSVEGCKQPRKRVSK